MKIGTFINHGTIIEIESVQTMNLSVDKGQVCIGEQSLQEFVDSHVVEAVQEGDADAQEDAPSEAEPPTGGFQRGSTEGQRYQDAARCGAVADA